MKRCSRCREEKGLEAFSADRSKPDGRVTTCRDCQKAHKRAYRASKAGDPEYRQKVREKSARDRAERPAMIAQSKVAGAAKKYGVSEAVVRELRNTPCMICGTSVSRGSSDAMQIDHDHETGAVRGSLCQPCNTGLGKFRDSPELLTKAIQYLARGADYRAVDQDN